MFRGHTFILGLDAGVILHENFSNLLTDIAVLNSLQIRLLVVLGLGQKMRELAENHQVPISDDYGFGATDAATLELAIEANGLISHEFLSRATQAGLRCEISNGLRSTERGTVKGMNYQFTGRVESADLPYFRNRIETGAVPVVLPIVYTRDGRALRLNSDHTASELAIRLQASKLIFLTRFPGLTLGKEPRKNIPLEALEKELASGQHGLEPSLKSKAEECCRALQAGVPRAHILDATRFGGLLTEIFEKEGIGTMVHANDYEQIRKATRSDLNAIYNLTREGVRSDALRRRTRQSIENDLERFFVYEIDDSLIACACLTPYPEEQVAELGTVYVHPFYQGRGIGRKMVEFATEGARTAGLKRLLALSSQNFTFFKERADFSPGTLEDLPSARLKTFDAEKRGSQILVKTL